MYKAKIIQKKSINSVMLIMDYVDGGDLRYHIGKRRRFNETETKFFIANLIVGL